MRRLDTGRENRLASFSVLELARDIDPLEKLKAPLPPIPIPLWKKVITRWAPFILLWAISSIFVIFFMKQAVDPKGTFPYGFAFSSFTQFMTALMAYILSRVISRDSPPRTPFAWNEIMLLLASGLLGGVEIGLTNKALEYLSVSDRTMINSTNVLFMMITAWTWGLERLGGWRILSALLVVVGGCFQGMEERVNVGSPLRAMGQCMQLTSMLLSAQKWAVTQHSLKNQPPDSALGQLNKFQYLAYTLPLTGSVCFVLALLFERSPYSPENLCQAELLLHVFSVSAGLIAMLYAELKLVGYISAVAFQVLGVVNMVVIIVVGITFSHDRVGIMSAIGTTICGVGAVVYVVGRQFDWQHRTLGLHAPSAPSLGQVLLRPSFDDTAAAQPNSW